MISASDRIANEALALCKSLQADLKQMQREREQAIALAIELRAAMRKIEETIRERCAFVAWCHGYEKLAIELRALPLVTDDTETL